MMLKITGEMMFELPNMFEKIIIKETLTNFLGGLDHPKTSFKVTTTGLVALLDQHPCLFAQAMGEAIRHLVACHYHACEITGILIMARSNLYIYI